MYLCIIKRTLRVDSADMIHPVSHWVKKKRKKISSYFVCKPFRKKKKLIAAFSFFTFSIQRNTDNLRVNSIPHWDQKLLKWSKVGMRGSTEWRSKPGGFLKERD